jgi:hypothetical protein
LENNILKNSLNIKSEEKLEKKQEEKKDKELEFREKFPANSRAKD